MNRPRQILPWVLSGFYALLIFAGSSVPLPAFPGTISLPDKLAHVLEYLPLGLLLMWAFWSSGSPTRKRALLTTVFVVMLYALSDEFHQSFVPGRQPEVIDGVMDVLGGLIGGSFFRWPK
jgi:VanZ family protein